MKAKNKPIEKDWIGSAPSPKMTRAAKARTKKSTANSLTVMKEETSSGKMSIENPTNMGLNKGPAEMKHTMDIPGYGTIQHSAAIRGPEDRGTGTGRAMVVTTLPNGTRQPFYQRSGSGGSEGASNKGDWVPIDGIDTGGHSGQAGWMDKSRLFDHDLPRHHPLQRYGTEDFMKIGKAFDNHRDTLGTPTEEEFGQSGHGRVDHNHNYGGSPWSMFEINNWLGNDIAKEHNEWAKRATNGMEGNLGKRLSDKAVENHAETVKARTAAPRPPIEDIPTEEVTNMIENTLLKLMKEESIEKIWPFKRKEPKPEPDPMPGTDKLTPTVGAYHSAPGGSAGNILGTTDQEFNEGKAPQIPRKGDFTLTPGKVDHGALRDKIRNYREQLDAPEHSGIAADEALHSGKEVEAWGPRGSMRYDRPFATREENRHLMNSSPVEKVLLLEQWDEEQRI